MCQLDSLPACCLMAKVGPAEGLWKLHAVFERWYAMCWFDRLLACVLPAGHAGLPPPPHPPPHPLPHPSCTCHAHSASLSWCASRPLLGYAFCAPSPSPSPPPHHHHHPALSPSIHFLPSYPSVLPIPIQKPLPPLPSHPPSSCDNHLNPSWGVPGFWLASVAKPTRGMHRVYRVECQTPFPYVQDA